MNRIFASLIAIPVVFLAGCGGPSATFEIGRPTAESPVSATQVPLHVPPEYALRPGTETAPAIRPEPAPRIGLSSGENALLAMAGVAEADPRIRTLVDQESTTLAVIDPYTIERLVLGAPPPPPDGLTIERTRSVIVDDPLSLF